MVVARHCGYYRRKARVLNKIRSSVCGLLPAVEVRGEFAVARVFVQDNETLLIVDYGYDETATVSLWQVRRE